MDFAQEVKAAADIVSVVGALVRLKRQSGDRHVGLCPFHTEKTPSFSVHAGLQIYKCFGCGKTGDVFNFLMELQGLSFFEVLKLLAEQQGKQVPRKGGGPTADAAARKREGLLHVHDLAQQFFVRQLGAKDGSEATLYLKRRGLGRDAVKEFGLGYAPGGNQLMRYLKGRQLKRSHVLESGLVGQSDRAESVYSRFRDRLMFPIHSDGGSLIGYGGRSLRADRQPKYLNSPETPIYRKNAVLYNIHRARAAMRQSNQAVLVEGYMDVIGVWRAGIRNAVATCGTALTSRQIGLLRRHCDTVVVNFDSDEAGQAAAERSVEMLLRDGMQVRVLELPGGLDPDEYCREHGGESYRQLLERAPAYFRWLLDRSRKLFDLSTSDGRTKAFERLLASVALLPDDVQQATTVTELAQHIGLPQGLALARLRSAAKPSKRSDPATPDTDGLLPSERLLLVLLVSDEGSREKFLEPACEIAKRGLPSRKILAALQSAVKAGGPFRYEAVEGRLEGADRERLARLVFERDRPTPTIAGGEDLLASLERQAMEHEYQDVLRRIGKLDRSADLSELLERKFRLERDLGLAR
ncbi:MAG: DNA primase [Bryobacterales bacterium]|nr:DNA primase [Bryobacterales bacterium]